MVWVVGARSAWARGARRSLLVVVWLAAELTVLSVPAAAQAPGAEVDARIKLGIDEGKRMGYGPARTA